MTDTTKRIEPRPYPNAVTGMRYSECFSFDGGTLTINTTGGDNVGAGWLCFAEDELEWEANEHGKQYRFVRLANSELVAIRDQLNEIFPAAELITNDAEIARLTDASEPIDLDVLAVREILAQYTLHFDESYVTDEMYVKGRCDDTTWFQSALAVYRKHRQ